MSESVFKEKRKNYIKGANITAILKDMGRDIKDHFPHDGPNLTYTYDEEAGILPKTSDFSWCNFEYWENSNLIITEDVPYRYFQICHQRPISMYPRFEIRDFATVDSLMNDLWKQNIGKGLLVRLTSEGNVFFKKKKHCHISINGKYCEDYSLFEIKKTRFTYGIIFKTKELIYEQLADPDIAKNEDNFKVTINFQGKADVTDQKSRIVLNFMKLCESFLCLSNKIGFPEKQRHELNRNFIPTFRAVSVDHLDKQSELKELLKNKGRQTSDISQMCISPVDTDCDCSSGNGKESWSNTENFENTSWKIIGGHKLFKDEKIMFNESISNQNLKQSLVSKSSLPSSNTIITSMTGSFKKIKNHLNTPHAPSFLELFGENYAESVPQMDTEDSKVFLAEHDNEPFLGHNS